MDPPVSTDTTDLWQLRRWIADCENNHPQCNSTGPAFLPSRLLDLSGLQNDNLIQLVETKELNDESEPKRYLALSYCWGDGGPTNGRAIRSNLTHLKKGFTLASLPATHIDFILVAQLLKVRYVWIDSLCVLQDFDKDWERESAKLDLIYSHAWFTVSALEPNHARAGIFGDAAIGGTVASTGAETSRTPTGANFSEWKQRFQTAALNKRGWTVQERELSTRVVHFYRGEMLWECRTAQATQLFPQLQLKTFLGRYFRILDATSVSGSGDLSIHASWRKMIEDYTTRSLRIPGDRLSALAGIVSLMQKSTKGEFIAGIWTTSITEDLQWITTGTKQPYPDEDRAPSWSWAAFDCPIKYNSGVKAGSPYHTFMGPTLEHYSKGESEKDVDGSRAKPLLRMKCRLKKVTMEDQTIVEYITEKQTKKWPYFLCFVKYDNKKKGDLKKRWICRQEIGSVDLDSTSVISKGQTLFCMYTSYAPASWFGDFYSDSCALLLTPSNPETREFRRIGLARGMMLPWWADSDVTTITLV
ncbi:heterokaryon incompatibility protein-domain-containing protein [Diaporthe sp. PMI_573]|nr:heterokaryon incompatibility protein-domain-containing protein [Diaporthaceae sp. PMI_573]